MASFELSPDLIRSMMSALASQPRPNRRQLADIFAVSEETIRSWTVEGMPAELVDQRGKGNEYQLIDCVTWLLIREYDRLTRETQKDRLDRIRADREEINLARDIGMLAPADDFDKSWTRNLMSCRAELLNLGPRLAAKLTAVLGIQVEEAPITEEVEKALQKLASATVDVDESEELELAYESESED